jgi:hypothetical protein
LGTTLLVPQCLVALAILAGSALPAQVVVGPPVCVPKILPPPGSPRLTPWFYEADSGEYVWGEHRFYEDPGNTVFSLAREMISLGSQQPGTYPDVLLFNVAQFDPPEGIPTSGPRRLMTASIEDKGLQLFVNYTDALIDPAKTVRYGQINSGPSKPVFFKSIDGTEQNEQTIPPVPWSGFSPVFVSATRGSFGCALTPVQPHKDVPLVPIPSPIAGPSTAFAASTVIAVPLTCQDLYVTAGLPYGLAELDPDPAQQVLAAQAQTDLLMHRNPTTGLWHDIAQDPCPGGPRIPVSATAGNSSGVVFADLTGDGWADLYVGKQGDGYLGEKNVLLVNDGTGCFQDQTAARIPGELVRATNDVAAIDLDGDNDLDLAVADRCRRDGTCGAESEDYALINDGTGHFTVVALAPGVFSDSRSVALGDLNHDNWPEIVLGNAGSDGFSNTLALSSPAEDFRMQIFVNNAVLNGTQNQFTDFMVPILDPFPPSFPIEHEVTAPLTQQVLLVDLFHPTQPLPPPGSPPLPGVLNTPDGWLDLIIVSQRDILKNDDFFASSSRVYVLANSANWSGAPPFLGSFTAFPLDWARTAAVADFNNNGFKDLFLGRGNRFSGTTASLESSLGDQAPGRLPWDNFSEFKSYETMPGNEHGYGFDFADVDGDGALDALQASRGYNYLVRSILGPVETEHEDFVTAGLGNGQSDNRRGRLIPHGMEDGVFADFDRDGDVDALLASQRSPSGTWPFCDSVTPDSIILVNDGSGHFGYNTTPAAVAPCAVEDARVDVNQRTSDPLPGIADRAVAGDLDNDGDVDALVHLFELHPANTPFEPYLPVLGQGGTPFPQPIASYAFGWRYLQNVIGEAGAGSFWFRDVAPTRMRNAAGVLDPNWNRGLGMDVLADFDNNGGLDLYTTVGFAKQLNAQVQQVTNIEQTDDLLFLNGVSGTAKGILTESAAAVLPARCQDQVKDTPTDFDYASCGSFGIAQGDIDGDGDSDVVVAHFGQSGRTNYPWLLINLLNDQGSSILAFQDQFQSRIPVASLSPIIHTADATVGGVVKKGMDYAMFPTLVDLDADGDLDLVYQVVNDLPRILLNAGKDSNGDGVINKLDTPPPGTFTDATPTVLQQLKPTTDAQDLAALDVDRDGDFDLANDPFSDRVTFWRNDLPVVGGLPAVTEIWPRVGSIRRRTVRLEGIYLDNITKVQFRFAGGATCESTLLTPIGTAGRQLDVTIPASCPLGLAQVRVQRTTTCSTTTLTQRWSRQYFGYFILG